MKWPKLVSLIAAAFLALAPIAKAEQPEKPKLNLSARVDMQNKYVYRGFNYSDTQVFQPTLSANYRELTVIGFGNYDPATGQFNEVDGIVDITNTFGKATLSIGYAKITFPNTEFPETQEVYGAIALDMILNPNIMYVYDFEDGDGSYIEGGIGHDFKLGKLVLSTSAMLAYNDHYYREDSDLSHAEVSVSAPIELDDLTITPSISQTIPIADDFEEQTWFGVSLEYGF